MKLELKNGQVIFTMAHNDLKAMPESGTKLSSILATTGRIQSVPMVIDGKNQIVEYNFTAYTRIPGRKKLKDGSTIDVKTGEVLCVGKARSSE